jgi:hypothetical protein
VDGRVLIDSFGYSKHHDQQTRQGGKGVIDVDYPVIDQLQDKDPDVEHDEKPDEKPDVKDGATTLFDDGFETSDSEDNEVVYSTAVTAAMKQAATDKKSTYMSRLGKAAIAKNRDLMLTRKKDLMFLNPMLKGYDMKSKVWLNMYVDDIRPMEWNTEAYAHLVYPEEQKDLVYSFVANHCSNDKDATNPFGGQSSGFADVIKGKGSGLVMLLSGPPGTGKTLTAEAVADKTHRPLLYMHAEDLGVNPSTLGANLKKMFEMAVDWNAICLLDECDVFLAARNPVDIQRNELCSIFLREIEYFEGILFLTTNLYDTIDTAFRSRVSMHLRFNPLAPDARLVLWKKFLSRLPDRPRYSKKKEDDEATQEGDSSVEMVSASGFLGEEDLKELSLWELNGREIKSVIKTVKCWSDVKKFDIDLVKMEAGIRVTAPNAHKRGVADTSLYDD